MQTTVSFDAIKNLNDALVKAGWLYAGAKILADKSETHEYTAAMNYQNLGRAVKYTVQAHISRYGKFSYCILYGAKYNAKTKELLEGQNLGEWTTISGALAGVKPKLDAQHKKLLAVKM